MKDTQYKALAYRVLAHASHLSDVGSWPYFTDRVQRRITGNRLRAFSPDETQRTYGSHVRTLREAFQTLGLGDVILNPYEIFPDLFDEGYIRIAALHVPFSKLGIAGASDLRMIYSAALALKARDMLETGVALGWSSLVLLKAAEASDGRLVSIDMPYPFLVGRSWVGAVVPDELRARWTLIDKADRLGIPRALAVSRGYDLIHYDSDKSPEGRRWAYPRLWSALRCGGLLISDDVGDNEAWAEFCRSIGSPLILVRRDRVLAGIARKKDFLAAETGRDHGGNGHAP